LHPNIYKIKVHIDHHLNMDLLMLKGAG